MFYVAHSTVVDLLISSPKLNTITLTLKRANILVDAADFEFDRDLDLKLIQAIDKILVKNRIDLKFLRRIHIDMGIDRLSSMYRILATWHVAVLCAKNGIKHG